MSEGIRNSILSCRSFSAVTARGNFIAQVKPTEQKNVAAGMIKARGPNTMLVLFFGRLEESATFRVTTP
jgi:hypothetical protein